METFLTVIHVLAALFMILVVLIQGGNPAVSVQLSAVEIPRRIWRFRSDFVSRKVTYVVAAVFMVTSVSLTVFQGSSGDTGLTKRLEEAAQTTAEPDAQDAVLPRKSYQSPRLLKLLNNLILCSRGGIGRHASLRG